MNRDKENGLCVIPAPASVQRGDGCFRLDASWRIVGSGDPAALMPLSDHLRETLRQATGIVLPSWDPARAHSAGRSDGPVICLRLDGAGDGTGNGPATEHAATGHATAERLAAEGYRLLVDSQGVDLRAARREGLVRGIQTLVQLLPPGTRSAGDLSLPSVAIEDLPRFSWRGMHLDVSRHFFPPPEIRKFIDLLALYKMNVFHWHLTDDQGWRIEVPSYPRLTEVGAWREEGPGRRYGGFYTRQEVREIVEYAGLRGITVVPEIEMPGHARAALAAYPEYSCSGRALEVPGEWGIFEDVFCPGKEETFDFLGDVLEEVCSLFPGPWVHLGGDECPRDRWREHGLCQERMRVEGLGSEGGLQAYFFRRICRCLAEMGKTPVGWDEVFCQGIPRNVVVMAWRSQERGAEAATAGWPVIMTPTSHCYFDYYQAEAGEPQAIGGLLPLEKVYAFEPLPEGLGAAARDRILGTQGNVWTEYMPALAQVQYMAVPRLCALAEVAWSQPALRDYPDFRRRLQDHGIRLGRMGVNFRPG